MSTAFRWVDSTRGSARSGGVGWRVVTKPDLGVPYSTLDYADGAGTLDDLIPMSAAQLAVIEQILADTPHANTGEVVPAVDADGAYIGLRSLPLAAGETRVPGAPRSPGVRWDFEAGHFVFHEEIAATISRALDAIDNAAGAARLRYITDVPGQQGTYLTKAAQAEIFVADPDGAVPAYIAAEAAATGLSPLAAAGLILATRDAWEGIVGPRIEQLRRWHSEQVKPMTSRAAVEAQVALAKAELAEV